MFRDSNPDISLLDVYPIAYDNPPCDYSMKGFGYDPVDFVQFGQNDDDFENYIRAMTRFKEAGDPLWLILQIHN